MKGVSVPGEKRRKSPSAPIVPAAEPQRNLSAEPRRNFAPRGIAALVAPITRPAFRRRAPAAAQLLADWPQLAGPQLAARAVPVKFAGGTLTLGCTGPTAMELQFSEAQIIARLNLALGHAVVERLRFVQQSPRLPAAPPRRPAAPRNLPIPADLPPGELGEALARLYRGIKTRG
ncbi:DUF721 domain-containing protein [Acidocella sp.]|uniref:DUF721 domain-containing protein n=1 Tax=Acidocella sp. TaxID=50710 RepID=UPI0026195610|nr:DUF721 domain-containing protein [Acidocella sp.]